MQTVTQTVFCTVPLVSCKLPSNCTREKLVFYCTSGTTCSLRAGAILTSLSDSEERTERSALVQRGDLQCQFPARDINFIKVNLLICIVQTLRRSSKQTKKSFIMPLFNEYNSGAMMRKLRAIVLFERNDAPDLEPNRGPMGFRMPRHRNCY